MFYYTCLMENHGSWYILDLHYFSVKVESPKHIDFKIPINRDINILISYIPLV